MVEIFKKDKDKGKKSIHIISNEIIFYPNVFILEG